MNTKAPAVQVEATTAGHVSDAETGMSEKRKTFWQRNRIAIILGIVALCLYAGSIFWMVYGRGQIA